MYSSRIPRIAASLPALMDAATAAAAERIADDARERVPVRTGKLRDAIHTERRAPGEHAVVAGNTSAFYGHIIEFGGARTPPRPFLIPALESNREQAVDAARAIMGAAL